MRARISMVGTARDGGTSAAAARASAVRTPARPANLAQQRASRVSRSQIPQTPAQRDGTSHGEPLAAGARTRFEQTYGADLSHVRLHHDAQANTRATTLGARAYTLGQDVHFARGAYAPESGDGQRLLAHELAHVVQQQRGPARVQRACGPNEIGAGFSPEVQRVAAAPEASARFLFDVNCDRFSGGFREALVALAQGLPAGTSVRVTGMASSEGAPAFNEALSSRRAQAAAEVLRANGVTVDALQATGGTGLANDAFARAAAVEMVSLPQITPEPQPQPGLPPPALAIPTLPLDIPGGLRFPGGKTPAPGFSTSVTPLDDFAGRSHKRLGLGERAALSWKSAVSSDPKFFGGLHWVIDSGEGTLLTSPFARDDFSGEAFFDAAFKPGDVQLSLRAGTSGQFVMDMITLKVVEPSGLKMSLSPGQKVKMREGQWGCGSLLHAQILPSDVSFAALQVKEGDATVQGHGWLEFKTGLHHCRGSGKAFFSGTNGCALGPIVTHKTRGPMMAGCDQASTGGHTTQDGPPFGSPVPAGDGNFTWDIPWEFAVPGGSPKQFAIAQVVVTATVAGKATLAKGGSGTIECERDDPAAGPHTCKLP